MIPPPMMSTVEEVLEERRAMSRPLIPDLAAGGGRGNDSERISRSLDLALWI